MLEAIKTTIPLLLLLSALLSGCAQPEVAASIEQGIEPSDPRPRFQIVSVTACSASPGRPMVCDNGTTTAPSPSQAVSPKTASKPPMAASSETKTASPTPAPQPRQEAPPPANSPSSQSDQPSDASPPPSDSPPPGRPSVSASQRVWAKDYVFTGALSQEGDNLTRLTLNTNAASEPSSWNEWIHVLADYVYDAGCGQCAGVATYRMGANQLRLELSGPHQIRDYDLTAVASYTLTIQTLDANGKPAKAGWTYHLDGAFNVIRYEASCGLAMDPSRCGQEEIEWDSRGHLPPLGLGYLGTFANYQSKNLFPVKVHSRSPWFTGLLERTSFEPGEPLAAIPVMQQTPTPPTPTSRRLFPGAESKLFSDGVAPMAALDGLLNLTDAQGAKDGFQGSGCVARFMIGRPSVSETIVQGVLHSTAWQDFELAVISDNGQATNWIWSWEKKVDPTGQQERYALTSREDVAIPFGCQAVRTAPGLTSSAMDHVSQVVGMPWYEQPDISGFMFYYHALGGPTGERIPTYTSILNAGTNGLAYIARQAASGGQWKQISVASGEASNV